MTMQRKTRRRRAAKLEDLDLFERWQLRAKARRNTLTPQERELWMLLQAAEREGKEPFKC